MNFQILWYSCLGVMTVSETWLTENIPLDATKVPEYHLFERIGLVVEEEELWQYMSVINIVLIK